MKNWRHLALKDEEMKAIMDFATREEVSFDIAIHYLLEGGLMYYNGVSKQARLAVPRESK